MSQCYIVKLLDLSMCQNRQTRTKLNGNLTLIGNWVELDTNGINFLGN